MPALRQGQAVVCKGFAKINPTGPGLKQYWLMVATKGSGPAAPHLAARGPEQSAALSGSAPFAAKAKAFAASLRDALADAQAALRHGEAVDAERQAKAVSALVKAARDTAEFENVIKAQPDEHDVEDLRADLRRRLAQFVEADLAGAPDEVLERIALEGLPR
jgi:hypothetical protein